MQVKRLEERLQVDLFLRTKTEIVLTSAGDGFLDYARRILRLNEEAFVRLQDKNVGGLVRLGVMEDYGTSVIPPILKSFALRFPQIHLEMQTGLTSTMPGKLGTVYDLVLAMHPDGCGEGEVVCRELAVWAGSPDHRVHELTPIPLALYPQGCLFRAWATEALDRAGRPWRLSFISHSQAAVEAIVDQGMAVTVLKSRTFPSRLRALSVDDGMPSLPAADIRLHRAPHLSRAASLLAEHLTKCLALLPNASSGNTAIQTGSRR
jgi:DNA-binding transcriptional LysR family regulator